ncbi:zinc finger-like protein [Cordyceps javanica]|uniref:Zinc finger-like protein n=1 Tax=Cordyceps javanica TaxID=43265 RepID=A0A545UKL0_9HYPO|nr:zinc finger-like protein [Cordyceps javanica]
MQSLAGIYVDDYIPNKSIRLLVNERFVSAEARLSKLLQDQRNLGINESSELMTLALLLSMQDVVLTERRVQDRYTPRLLTGFRQVERVLQSTDDPESRFYCKKSDAAQVSALRTSQSVVVGGAVVLAQTMMSVSPLATFNPIAETSRFGFLLHGSEADLYEIHGGCGFSRRLLHIFSQVTHCSTRMLQDAETPIVPVTAEALYDHLMKMHQWSGEYDSWEAANSKPQAIEWIRQTDENYVIKEAKQMTEVTAET